MRRFYRYVRRLSPIMYIDLPPAEELDLRDADARCRCAVAGLGLGHDLAAVRHAWHAADAGAPSEVLQTMVRLDRGRRGPVAVRDLDRAERLAAAVAGRTGLTLSRGTFEPLRLFLQWLLLNSALLFALWLCWTGLIATRAVGPDPGSQAILGLFVAAPAVGGLRAWVAGARAEQVHAILRRARASSGADAPAGRMHRPAARGYGAAAVAGEL